MPDELDSSPVAGALIMLAVQKWADDYRHHLELAGAAYEECVNGFKGVEGSVMDAARDALIDCLKTPTAKK
jgi:hypothetical protein